MPRKSPAHVQRALEHAYQLLTQALDLLDACKAPPGIAPHLELALSEIKQAIAGRGRNGGGGRQER